MQTFKKPEGKSLIHESYDRLLAAWGVQLHELDVPTKYGSTHLIISGHKENPPLLLFHGVGDHSALMWIYNIQELSKHFYVIAIDTMGGPGKSQPNEAYYKSFELSSWIHDVINQLHLGKVHIAGVSYGSYIASYFTIKNPNQVHNVVCMAGGMKVNMLRMIMIFLPEALFPTEKNTKKLLRKLTAPQSDVFEKNQELMLQWTYLLKFFNNRSMMFHKVAEIPQEELSILRDKAIFLIGEYDRLANYPKAIKHLAVNQMNVKIVANAGHGINHEQPDLINREIIQFLTKVSV
ncbi:Carboxylesterase YbfK [compost metagenome]